MPSPHFKAPSFSDILLERMVASPKKGNDSYRTAREQLKVLLFHERSELHTLHGRLWRVPTCPVCHRPVSEPDMHEGLLKRGDVDYSSEEVQAMIFVPENCVLVHPGNCHQVLQFGEEGLMLTLWNILDHCKREDVLSWLEEMKATLKSDRPAYLMRYILDFCHTPKGGMHV